ncbi:MAG: polyprenyl diphosphate synthase, partial [Planctomycetales bacterium]
IELTRENSGTRLCLAVNYGARAELLDAVRRIAQRVDAGELRPDELTEDHLSGSLDTAGMLDPDLLIRTAGEMRVSNFLLWQISYAEIWVTDRLWPDFREPDFHAALRDYARRDRRFGGLNASATDHPAADPTIPHKPAEQKV